MDLSQLLYAYRYPYSWMLIDRWIGDILLQSRQLDFDMEAQTQSNWCWAATSTSVSHFYWSWSYWTQCLVANGELGLTDCCDSSVPAACNVPWYLDSVLDRTKNLVSYSGVASFETVRAEIDAGRPVGARVGWSGGGGHFMVIYGYSILGGTQYFNIDDPIYGKSSLTVADFTHNYQGSGSWTHTYMTKRYIPRLYIKPFPVREPLIKVIWAARPLLNPAALPLTQSAEPDEAWLRASLSLAHRVYALGLDDLRQNAGLSAAAPVAVRVLENADNQLQALFDVSDEESPRVLQLSASRPYLERLSRGLGQVLAFARQRESEREEQASEEAEMELRLLRVPALNFEAFWLRNEREESDWLVPVVSLGSLSPFEPVPAAEALKALNGEARALAEMDDRMGA